MNAKDARRLKALLPKGRPRFVRVYDNEGETADRYTVVFTGRYRYRNDNQVAGRAHPVNVLHMSGAPYHPQGVCGHAEWDSFLDCPEGWAPALGRKSPGLPQLGRRIAVYDLPHDCQRAVMEDYIALWALPAAEAMAAWHAAEGNTDGPSVTMSEDAPPALPGYFDCGGCGHYHRKGWAGDCRDDAERFTAQALDDKHGPEGWEEVPEHAEPAPCAKCGLVYDPAEDVRIMGPEGDLAVHCPLCHMMLGHELEGPPEEALVRAGGPEAEALVAAGVLARSHDTETPESGEREARIGAAVLEARQLPLRYGVRYFAGGTYTGEDWPESGQRIEARALGLKWESGGEARTFEVVTNREVLIQRVEGRQVFATEEEMEEAVATGRARIAVPSIDPPHAQFVQIMDRGDDGRLRPNQAHAHLNPGDAEAGATFFRQGTETARLGPAGGAEEAERLRQARRAVEEWAGNRLNFPSNGIDLEFHWHAEGYCLALMDTGETEGTGGFSKARVAYLLLGPQPEDVIAEGRDMFPSPMVDATGRRAAADFVAIFLTWGDGDLELTPRQKLFFAVEAGRVEDWASDLEEDEQAHTGETEEF